MTTSYLLRTSSTHIQLMVSLPFTKKRFKLHHPTINLALLILYSFPILSLSPLCCRAVPPPLRGPIPSPLLWTVPFSNPAPPSPHRLSPHSTLTLPINIHMLYLPPETRPMTPQPSPVITSSLHIPLGPTSHTAHPVTSHSLSLPQSAFHSHPLLKLLPSRSKKTSRYRIQWTLRPSFYRNSHKHLG